MKHISLFTGIGGFDYGFRDIFETVQFVENDKKLWPVLKKNWMGVPIWDDVSTYSPINVGETIITGGFPCQDVSVAGAQAGLHSERSGLFFEFMRIVNEAKPQFFVIENVKGLFTSNGGKDFETVLNTITEIGYDAEWALLDTRQFGIPQRRERVYIVGYPKSRLTNRPLVFTDTGRGRENLDSVYEEWKDTAERFSGGSGKAFRKVRRPHSNTDHETWEESWYANTLNLFDTGRGRATTLITTDNGIRMLTIQEQLLIQGFDPYHLNRTGLSRSKALKATGNAVTATIPRWIARQLQAVV